MKKSLFSIMAIAIAIFAVAFTSPSQSVVSGKSLTEYYFFEYNNNVVEPLLLSEPTRSTNPHTYCDDEGDYICTRAYLPADTETFSDGGTTKRRPKSNGVIQIEVKKVEP